MTFRFQVLLCFGLLLGSCNKPREAMDQPEDGVPPRLTKTSRPVPESPPGSPERPDENFKTSMESESPEERNRALAAAVWDALERDPKLALEGFAQLSKGSEEKNRLLEHLAMRLAEADVEEAIQWANALETEEEKSLAFGKIALILSENEPERAAHLLSDSGVAGRDFDVAVVQIVQRWAQESPTNALAWVVLFDAGEARRAGLKEGISIWATADPQAAFSWISSLQDEAIIHQEAAQGMAEAILDQAEDMQDEWLALASPDIQARYKKLKSEAQEN